MANKIKGLGDAVERYIQGCGKFRQAIEGWQPGNVSRYEDGLIDSAIKVGSALELSLKVYLKHVVGNQLSRDEQDVVYGKANFADMLRLMKLHATPPLDEGLRSHLLDYRDMRNQAEHHGAVPRRGELKAACETIGQFMLVYLPLEDRERRRIQHGLAGLIELGQQEDGKTPEEDDQRVYYRSLGVTAEAGSLDEIRNSWSEIRAYGVTVPELTLENGLLVAQAQTVPALLRERQTVFLERHTLFAGRESQLAQIHDFLARQSKGYVYVTGPSGYGKSALLANLIAPSPDRFVWHFLNRLDGTHTRTVFLRSMVEQLLAYYRMPVRSEADLPAADDRLEALYSKLLRMPLVRANRPLILVIDGIDEAEEGFIRELHIPRSLPEGKFIVFSGRTTGQDYLRQLAVPGEQTLTVTLERMDAAAIRSMLSQAGGAATSSVNNLSLVHQIARVSGGDPFYLRYMVEDIATGAISPDVLAKQPAGLEHYLDGWWRQIAEPLRSERDLRDLMGILMVAPGPVPEQELLLMAPELEWSLDVILPPVRRFVTVGQLGEQRFYSLCHPRFQQYLADHKLKNQVLIYRERLLDHCAQWREHRSAFVLNHYASLLAHLGRWDELHELVAKGAEDKQEWAEARRQADGSYAGYLSDLHLAWQQADKDGETNPRAVGRQVRYALIESSIRSIAINVAPDLLEAAIECQVPGWTPSSALRYALLNPDESHRVAVLARMASRVTPEDLLEALTTLSSFRNESERLQAASIIRIHLPTAALTTALGIIDAIADLEMRRQLEDCFLDLWDVRLPASLLDSAELNYSWDYRYLRRHMEEKPYLVDPISEEDFRELFEGPGQTSEDLYTRDIRLADIIPSVPDQLLPRALDCALSEAAAGEFINPIDPDSRDNRPVEPLALLAPRLTPDLLTFALQKVKEIEQEYYRVRALMALYPHLPSNQRHEAVIQALAAAHWIHDESERALALGPFLKHMRRIVFPSVLSFLGGKFQEPLYQDRTVARLGIVVPVELLEDYLRLIEGLHSEITRIPLITALLSRIPSGIRRKYVTRIVAQFYHSYYAAERVRSMVAPFLTEEDFQYLLAEANSRSGKGERLDALCALIPHLPLSLRGEAMSVAILEAAAEEDAGRRLRAMVKLVPYSDHGVLYARVEDILQDIQQLPGLQQKRDLLQELAQCLPIEPSETLMNELVVASESLAFHDTRAYVLQSLAQKVSPTSREVVLRKALDVVLQMSRSYNKAWALYDLLKIASEDIVCAAFQELPNFTSQPEDTVELAIVGIFLPNAVRANVAEEILRAAKDIIGHWEELDTRIITELAPKLPSHLKPEGYKLALDVAQEAWTSSWLMETSKEDIVINWCGWVEDDRTSAFVLWKSLIHGLSQQNRPRFFTILARLEEVITPLGGPESAAEAVEAMLDVGKWWP